MVGGHSSRPCLAGQEGTIVMQLVSLCQAWGTERRLARHPSKNARQDLVTLLLLLSFNQLLWLNKPVGWSLGRYEIPPGAATLGYQ